MRLVVSLLQNRDRGGRERKREREKTRKVLLQALGGGQKSGQKYVVEVA